MLVKHQMQINTIKGGTDFMKKVIAIMLTLATLSVMGGGGLLIRMRIQQVISTSLSILKVMRYRHLKSFKMF